MWLHIVCGHSFPWLMWCCRQWTQSNRARATKTGWAAHLIIHWEATARHIASVSNDQLICDLSACVWVCACACACVGVGMANVCLFVSGYRQPSWPLPQHANLTYKFCESMRDEDILESVPACSLLFSHSLSLILSATLSFFLSLFCPVSLTHASAETHSRLTACAPSSL